MKLTLDPDWEMATATESHPRSPQAILCNGVVVGYRIDGCGGYPERVIAAGGDKAIQWHLDQWWIGYTRQRQAERDKKAEIERAEYKRRQVTWAAEARKAMGI